MTGIRQRPAVFATLLLWLMGLAWVAEAAAPLPVSPTPHYIRDDAHWLSPAAFQALDTKLKAFERETSSQIVVAIFPKIPEGEELFDFSQRLFEAWKPGQADKDNGAIFLIFADDRKMRIHTGFGMEGVLPDARSKQIIQDVVAPQLRQGNREAAINAGVDAMIAAAKGEYTGTGKTRLDGSDQGKSSWTPLLFLLLIAGFFVIRGVATGAFTMTDVIFSVLGASRGSGDWGGGSSGGGWGGGGSGGGGFSGGGGDSGGGGASGDW
jgi:uncharacterized protein